jgi:hypothetical protein
MERMHEHGADAYVTCQALGPEQRVAHEKAA